MIKEIEADKLFGIIKKPLRRWPGIIIHHTAYPDTDKLDASVLYGEKIDRMHREGRGWNGMGYHLLINPDGTIQAGNRWIDQIDGAHARGHNCFLGIALIGNFSRYGVLPLPIQLRSFHNIMDQFPKLRAYPHRLFSQTECPGLNINLELWFRMFEKNILFKGG